MAFYQTPPPQAPLPSSVVIPSGGSVVSSQVYDPSKLAQTPNSQSPAGPSQPLPSSSAPSQATSTFSLIGDRQRTSLWMGELESYMDETFIKHAWFQLGENVQVKMIRDRYTGGFANYCFIEMASHERAAHALSAYNNQTIPGSDKAFRLNWASGGNSTMSASSTTAHSNGTGSSNASNGGSDMDRSPEFSIFIGDLAPEVTEPMLLGLFQTYYKSVKTAKVVVDTATGTPKGYGFVRFFEESDQHRALNEMQGVYCGSRSMRISMATPKNRPGGPLGPVVATGAPMYTTTTTGAVTPVVTHPLRVMEYNQFTDPSNTTVFVGGLTGFTTEDDLRNTFSRIGEVTYVKIPPGKNCGFVQFLHRQCAEQALAQMNGCLIGTSRVRLSWGRPQHIPPSAVSPFSRVTHTFTPAPVHMANMAGMPGLASGMTGLNGLNNMASMNGMNGMAGMPGLTGYPGYYPAPVMAPVMQGVFSAQPQPVITSPIPQHSYQMVTTPDPREVQPTIPTSNQFVKDREDPMLSLDFVGPSATA